MLCNIPEERMSHLYGGESPKINLKFVHELNDATMSVACEGLKVRAMQ